jgi:hypothetical protein
MILVRTAVTALNFGCSVSSSLLPADKNLPSAPNVWATWFFCAADNVLRVPSYVKPSRTAAMVVYSLFAGVLQVVGSSRTVVMVWSSKDWKLETS